MAEMIAGEEDPTGPETTETTAGETPEMTETGEMEAVRGGAMNEMEGLRLRRMTRGRLPRASLPNLHLRSTRSPNPCPWSHRTSLLSCKKKKVSAATAVKRIRFKIQRSLEAQ